MRTFFTLFFVLLSSLAFGQTVSGGGAINNATIISIAQLAATTPPLPNCAEQTSYLNNGNPVTLTATGGIPPYTWAISSGSLPVGLSLNGATGVISGTCTTVGSNSFTVTVTDSAVPANIASQSLSITVTCTVSCIPPLSVTTTSCPNGTQNQLYQCTLAATGGTTPYVWSISSGSIPTWATLVTQSDNTGLISGTPPDTSGGTFVATVTDSSSPLKTANSVSITITISPANTLTIITTSCPNGITGQLYNCPLQAVGGTPPYTWSLASGSLPLPPWATIDSANQVIKGTPTGSGSNSFTIQVADSSSPPVTDTQGLFIQWAPLSTSAPILPQLWVNSFACDPPGGTYQVTKTIKADGTGDFACSMPGLQAAVDQWAGVPATATDFSEHLIIDATNSPRGRCSITGANPLVLRTKTLNGALPNKCLVIESSSPNAVGQTVCTDTSDPFAAVRNPGCATGTDKQHMWGLTSTNQGGNNGTIIQGGVPDPTSGWGSNHIVIRDAEITPSVLCPTCGGSFMISLTPHSSGGVPLSLPRTNFNNYGTTIGFERNYIHGDIGDAGTSAAGYDVLSDIINSPAYTWLMWNYLDQLSGFGAESHGFSTIYSTGPQKIVGNYIEWAGVNMFWGGSTGATLNEIPSDIEVRRNVLSMNPAWINPAVGCVGGKELDKKSNNEWKIGKRVLINGNIYQWSTGCGQQGQLLTLNVRASSGNVFGDNYLAEVSNFRITNNIFAHATAGIEMDGRGGPCNSGQGVTQPVKHIDVINNLFYDMAQTGGRKGSFFSFTAGGSANDWLVSSATRDSQGRITMQLVDGGTNLGLSTQCTQTGGTGYHQTQIQVGDPVQVIGCSTDTSINTTTPQLVTALSGTIPNGLTVVYPSAGNAGTLNVTGCVFTDRLGWTSDVNFNHNTYISEVGTHYPTSITTKGNLAKNWTVQDNLFAADSVQTNAGWFISGTAEGNPSEIAGWDRFSLTDDHDFWTNRPIASYFAYNPSCALAGNCLNGGNGAPLWTAAKVQCSTTVADASCVGFKGMMNTTSYLVTSTNPFVDYSLDPSSLYVAGHSRQAHDNTDMGVHMAPLHAAMTETMYSGCQINNPQGPNFCGSPPNSLGPCDDAQNKCLGSAPPGPPSFVKVGTAPVGAQNRIVFNPTNNKLYAVGRVEGGAAVSSDGGQTWSTLNNIVGGGTLDNLCLTGLGLNTIGEVIAAAPHSLNDANCTKMHMLRLVGNGNAWTVVAVPNNLPSTWSQANGPVISHGNLVLAGNGGGLPWYSTDNGATWNMHVNGLAVGACAERLSELSDNNQTVSVSLATCQPAWSTDGGVSWTLWTQPYIPTPPAQNNSWVQVLPNNDIIWSFLGGWHTWCLRGGHPDTNNSAMVRCDTGLPGGSMAITNMAANKAGTKVVAPVIVIQPSAHTVMSMTTDNANSWTQIANNAGIPAGVDLDSITVDTAGFMYVIDGNNGDVYKTTAPQ